MLDRNEQIDVLPTPLAPEPPPASTSSFFAPLRLHNFRLLLAGQTVSRFGDAFYAVAIPWLVLRSTSAPLALAVVLGAYAIALGLCTLLGGVLADRYGPRVLMLGADIARLILVAGLAAWALLGTLPLSGLIALSFLLGAASGLFYPASSAMTPYLVPPNTLQAANSFDQMTMQSSNFIGPSLAGVVLSAIHLTFGLVIDAASFAISVLSLLALRVRRVAAAPTATSATSADAQSAPQSGIAALAEAFRFLRGTPFLFTIISLSLVGNFAINGLTELALPLLIKQWVGLAEGPRIAGFVIGGFGLGSIIGTLVAGLASRLPHKPLFAILSILPTAILIGIAPLVGDVYPLVGTFFVIGLLIGFSNLLFITAIQRHIPIALMGRVMSFVLLGSFIGTPLSIFFYGTAATLVSSIDWLFAIGGGLFAIACLAALFQPVFWRTE